MELRKRAIDEQLALEILRWKYDPPYDFYNSDGGNEDLEELLDGSYYALVTKENELFGFFCTGKSAQVPAGQRLDVYRESLIDIGLGMNPLYTGQGRGTQFCSSIINLVEEEYKNMNIRLTVAKFNERAIHLYEKHGFKKENEFQSDRAAFITMVRLRQNQ